MDGDNSQSRRRYKVETRHIEYSVFDTRDGGHFLVCRCANKSIAGLISDLLNRDDAAHVHHTPRMTRDQRRRLQYTKD